jgi:hypothetical protein
MWEKRKECRREDCGVGEGWSSRGKSTPLHVKEVNCGDSAPRLGRFLAWTRKCLGCRRVAKGRARREIRGSLTQAMVRMPSDLGLAMNVIEQGLEARRMLYRSWGPAEKSEAVVVSGWGGAVGDLNQVLITEDLPEVPQIHDVISLPVKCPRSTQSPSLDNGYFPRYAEHYSTSQKGNTD